MEKKNLVAIIMAVPGGILFSIGMVLALMTEWDMLIPGIIMGAIGLIVLLAIIPVYRKLSGCAPIKLSARLVVPVIIGIVFTLLLGTGMALIMAIESPQTYHIIIGMIVGIIGLVGVILNPIICIYKRQNAQNK